MPVGNEDDRPVGEGDSHTARAHVTEGLDSGIVPMSPLNQGGKPFAENGKGMPLIKENTHQSRTHRHRAMHACPRDWRVCGERQGKGTTPS